MGKEVEDYFSLKRKKIRFFWHFYTLETNKRTKLSFKNVLRRAQKQRQSS